MQDKQFFKKLFQFDGQIGRLDYFYRIIPVVVFALILKTLEQSTSFLFLVIIFILWAASLWLWVCAVVQRLHDLNRPGSHFWLGCIPLYDIYFGCVLLFRKGVGGGDNREKKTRVPAIFFFWIAVAILFVIFITALSHNSQKTADVPIVTTQPPAVNVPVVPVRRRVDRATIQITNPDYLADPSSFMLDRQNVVSAVPQPNTPVWVEDFWDENSLLVSYPTIVAGKKVLKIQQLNLEELYDYDDLTITGVVENPVVEILKRQNKYADDLDPFINCLRQATVAYMKNNVMHNYIEIAQPAQDGSEISGYGVSMNFQELEQKMIADGFGIGSVNYNTKPETDYYFQDEQLAILSNAGMWGVCPAKQ